MKISIEDSASTVTLIGGPEGTARKKLMVINHCTFHCKLQRIR